MEQGHEYFTELQSQANEIDKQIEITQPLINLLDNMVTMGSLYGADNLLYAAEYKKVLEMLSHRPVQSVVLNIFFLWSAS